MIYLFTWNSNFLIREKISEWKELFVSKNWDFDLIHFKDLSDISNDELSATLIWNSFFDTKKLIIIDDLPLSWTVKNKSLSEKQDFLLPLLSRIPENNIVIFSSVNSDKRSKFYKELHKIADIKDFSTKSESDLNWIISKKYSWKISPSAVSLIVKYKSWDLSKIISELDKLFITYDFIDNKEIEKNIVPELEESIFQVIDDIMNQDIISAIKKINIILNDTNIYAFYNNLISNLRTNVYISKLKNIWINSAKIWEVLNLWNRSFLVNKSYKVSNESLSNLYINLVNIDKKMKSWKLTWTEDSDFKYELEKVLLSSFN